jgi:soluble lytic murein transglycosylase-like protein
MRAPQRCIRGACFTALLLVVASSAAADEAIARRLGALKSLVDPAAARPVSGPQAPAHPACAVGAWWRLTEYGVRSRTDGAIRDASLRFAVDPDLIRAVIRHESAYDVHAVSRKGAMGLMQLIPETARRMGVVCPFDPRENVLGGTRYLRRLRDRLGSWPRSLAAYHAGPRRVEEGRVPAETHRYVARVLRTWQPWRAGTLLNVQSSGFEKLTSPLEAPTPED